METGDRTIRPVRILDDRVARKIAAGEVIDRPAAVVRELMDNAIDAGSSKIDVYIEEGGVRSIRVVDDGRGMSKDDLELCVLPHATSKIAHEDDLLRVTSLGFRGEALASIGAVSRLSVVSKERRTGSAHRITVRSGRVEPVEECRGREGTVAEAADIFFSFPARKKFLKRTAAETAMCRSQFLEKALPYPDIAFRLSVDGSLRSFLPESDLAGRVAAAFPDRIDPRMLHEISGTGDGFSLRAVAGRPELWRKDRKYLQVYVNRRRVTEYALLQAVQYAYDPFMPGGRYPIAFVFLEIDPQLADFNIHPAKREVRLRNLQDVHHRVVEVFGSFLSSYALRSRASHSVGSGISDTTAADRSFSYTFRDNPPTGGNTRDGSAFAAGAFDSRDRSAVSGRQPFRLPERVAGPAENDPEVPFRYLGQVFGLFLAVEYEDGFFLVDQHAAHERILFDRFRAAPRVRQPLLIPYRVDLQDEEDERMLEAGRQRFSEAGIEIQRSDDGGWMITAVPEACAESLDAVTAFLREAPVPGRNPADALYAVMACRAAVKDGDPVDPLTAVRIVREAFALPDARCPHGRPVWHRIGREELFRLVGRE